MGNREQFWVDRFSEKSHHRDVINLNNHNIVDICQKYANDCLVEYDKTFKKD